MLTSESAHRNHRCPPPRPVPTPQSRRPRIATALDAGCEAFLCNDTGLRRVTELRVLVLDDHECDCVDQHSNAPSVDVDVLTINRRRFAAF